MCVETSVVLELFVILGITEVPDAVREQADGKELLGCS